MSAPPGWEGRLILARAALAEVIRQARESPPPELPPGVDWRPIEGFPRYAIDRDKTVWTARGPNGVPGPWRRVAVVTRGRNGTTAGVWLRDDATGRQRWGNLARLHRAAWLHPRLPVGDPGLEEIEDRDD